MWQTRVIVGKDMDYRIMKMLKATLVELEHNRMEYMVL